MKAIAPFQTVRIKNNASEWFDEIYKQARNTVQNLIRKKKKAYFEEKLKENKANPNKIWKTLKQLGLPEKRLPCTMSG